MPFDQHKNLAISRVIAPPSPATLGTAVDIVPGHEVRFPAPPFNVTIWPPSAIPDPANAEVARVTLIQANRLFIDRAVEGTTARAIQIGDFIAETITAKAFFDIESGTNFPLITTPGPITSGDSVTAPVGNFGTLNAPHAPQHEVGGSDPIDGALSLTTLHATVAISSNGPITGSHLGLAPAGKLYWDTRGRIQSPADGVLMLSNTAEADFSLLQFGGTTAAFPALRRVGNQLWLVNADNPDSMNTSFLTGFLFALSGSLFFDGSETVFVRAGTGNPEGSAVASPGAVFLRKDGGPGTTLYVKQSGTATNTGWLPVANVGDAPSLHAPTHAAGGTDPVTVTGLAGYPGGTGTFLRADATFAALPVGQQPGLHAPTHAIGGSDPVVKTFRTSQTWALAGDVTALVGFVPSFYVPFVGTQAVRIVGLRARIQSGTSVTVKLYMAGVVQTGGIAVSSTNTTTALNIPITVNEVELALELSAPVGVPTNLSVSVLLEHTV